MEKKTDFDSIDWGALWKAELSPHHWDKDRQTRKTHWDKRAEKFNRTVDPVKGGGEKDRSDYIAQMLRRIKVRPGWTVLDIGCGPGTLSIPLAKKAKSVTALDISPEMLRHLRENAEALGLANIRYLNASWEDALAGDLAGEHDVVVASRSLTPVDLEGALRGVAAAARRAVYLTLPIIHLPFDWEAYRAIGRTGKQYPPYIYVLNALYRLGIRANLEVLSSRIKSRFTSVDEAIEELQWRTEPFTPEEMPRLRAFLEEKFAGKPVFTHQGYSKWALIWWRRETA